MHVVLYVGWKLRQIRASYVLYPYLARDWILRCNLEYRKEPGNGNLHEPRCQEKRRSQVLWCPYRKPTQVDEERILRRPDQCSLRNSAKKQVYLRYIPCPALEI